MEKPRPSRIDGSATLTIDDVEDDHELRQADDEQQRVDLGAERGGDILVIAFMRSVWDMFIQVEERGLSW